MRRAERCAARSTHERAHEPAINIVGAGLAGSLLAMLLARRGLESSRLRTPRSDPRAGRAEAGRSINLALAARGIAALRARGPRATTCTARDPDARPDGARARRAQRRFLPYGQRAARGHPLDRRARRSTAAHRRAARRRGRRASASAHTCVGVDGRRSPLIASTRADTAHGSRRPIASPPTARAPRCAGARRAAAHRCSARSCSSTTTRS